MADNERLSLDSADEGTSGRPYREDEQDDELERRAGGMSRSSSVGAPSNSHEQGSIPATEAARSSDIVPDSVAGPSMSSNNTNPGTMHAKRRRRSSSPDDRAEINQALGAFSTARTQSPVLDPNLALSAFYHDISRGVSKEARPFEVSDARFPYVPSSVANQVSQPPDATIGSAMSHNAQPHFTTYKDISDAYALPRISDTAQASSSKTKDTPSSIQAISVGLVSAPTTFSTPRSGSGQSGLPSVMSLNYGVENPMYGVPEATRTASHIGGYDTIRDSHPARQPPPFDHNSSTYPSSIQRQAGDREHSQQAWLRSQRRPDTIFGAKADALGNAGITTVQPGAGVNGVMWWGPTSFLSLQDRLIQVLKARGQVEPQIAPDLVTMAPVEGVKDQPSSQSNDIGTNYTVWRWGCDKLIFGTKPAVDETAIPIDPLFLPSQLAHRFFRAYVVTIHTLYPVMDIDEVRGSISVAYAGGVDYRPDEGPRPSDLVRNLHKARNLMVLALGAQIEGGDGDAHCPKDIARAWSTNLADRAHKLLLETRDSGGVDAIRLWILYTVYLGNYGQVAVTKMYVASILCLRSRLIKMLRVLLQGKVNALRTVVNLVDFVDSVQAIYFNHERDVSRVSAIDKVNEVFEELETLRRSVPKEMLDFHSPDPDSPGTLLALDTPEGEMALFKFRLCLLYHNIRMLATLPLLSCLVWQDVTKQPFTANPQAVRIAAECVSSAEKTILAFQVYMAQIPYLPFVSIQKVS
ncbi:hypothetical protein QFC22_000942 [Naganishia vaughanmartiniae]|uniref:Uncharacterized protein n=1 Tax=Naganishia vaughanmartiniae TaxID=1424756 RepID=A0ACC2XKK7_9TREE|nr:hypothetical protein QFC22_000942 [Naganishia vaughanmartiniae]